MRVKIGDVWYTATPEQPIMVELTPTDKMNLAKMPPEANRYAVFDFPDGEITDEMHEQIGRWMDEGAL